jgi:hypothetical protein
MNFVRKHALAYQAEHGCDLETAACASSAMPRAPTAPTSTSSSTTVAGRTRTNSPIRTQSRKCFAYGPQRQGRVAGRAAQQHARRRAARLPEPRFRRARRYHHRPVLRHARRHPPRREARPRRRRTRLHRRPDHAAAARSARWPSRSRWRHARACSIRSGTRACSSTATRACARSSHTSPTPWAGRPPRGRSRPGSTRTDVRDLHSRRVHAAAPGGIPKPTLAVKVVHRLLEAHERKYWSPMRRASRRCTAPARISKTGSRACPEKVAA